MRRETGALGQHRVEARLEARAAETDGQQRKRAFDTARNSVCPLD